MRFLHGWQMSETWISSSLSCASNGKFIRCDVELLIFSILCCQINRFIWVRGIQLRNWRSIIRLVIFIEIKFYWVQLEERKLAWGRRPGPLNLLRKFLIELERFGVIWFKFNLALGAQFVQFLSQLIVVIGIQHKFLATLGSFLTFLRCNHRIIYRIGRGIEVISSPNFNEIFLCQILWDVLRLKLGFNCLRWRVQYVYVRVNWRRTSLIIRVSAGLIMKLFSSDDHVVFHQSFDLFQMIIEF